MPALTYPFIIIAGALQALGNAMNACLRKRLVNPWLAATASFVPIVIVFTVLFLALPMPLPSAATLERIHWYDAFGGVAGAVAVFCGLVFVDEVGSGAFNALTIVGNILMSLTLDSFGFFGLHRIGFEPVPWCGGALMAGGVYLISRGGGRPGDATAKKPASPWRILLFPLIFVAGTLQAIGAAVNAELRGAVVNPWLAADVSFVAVTMVFVAAFIVRPVPLPSPEAVASVRWWMPLAGIAGAVSVFAGLALIDTVGAGTFNGLTITANLLASLVLDHFGWLGMPRRAFGRSRAGGCIVMLAGIVLVSRTA